ncbi:hypothetical protein P7K49_008595, partial [Saguinus oedipus]
KRKRGGGSRGTEKGNRSNVYLRLPVEGWGRFAVPAPGRAPGYPHLPPSADGQTDAPSPPWGPGRNPSAFKLSLTVALRAVL